MNLSTSNKILPAIVRVSLSLLPLNLSLSVFLHLIELFCSGELNIHANRYARQSATSAVWLLFSRRRVGDGDYANAEVGYVLSHYNLSPFTIQNLHRLHEYMVIH